ncbi:MAG: HTH domain-containing protein [Candidatus Bathyarchaeota archaeon]|nr:MAG: HTH domain-containing protein [Candidatus Bathyarchaeota archaeon]
MGKLDKPILELLRESSKPLTLAEIAQKMDKPEKTIFKALRKLFEKGQIETRGRQYSLAKE